MTEERFPTAVEMWAMQQADYALRRGFSLGALQRALRQGFQSAKTSGRQCFFLLPSAYGSLTLHEALNETRSILADTGHRVDIVPDDMGRDTIRISWSDV